LTFEQIPCHGAQVRVEWDCPERFKHPRFRIGFLLGIVAQQQVRGSLRERAPRQKSRVDGILELELPDPLDRPDDATNLDAARDLRSCALVCQSVVSGKQLIGAETLCEIHDSIAIAVACRIVARVSRHRSGVIRTHRGNDRVGPRRDEERDERSYGHPQLHV
jgi:hypothetical protein